MTPRQNAKAGGLHQASGTTRARLRDGWSDVRQATTVEVRLDAGKGARFIASAQSIAGSTVCYARDARLSLPKPPEGAIVALATAGKSGNVGLTRYAGEFDKGRHAVRYTKLLLLAMVAAVGPSLTSAQELRPVANPEQLGFSSARLQRLTETYQGYVDRGELPGAVLLIARGDKIAYLQAVGYQDREKKTPMKVDAIFRLASMSKPIVSVAAMMLVEEGKLDLLAPVAQYLPEFKDLKVGVEQADIVGGKRALTLEPQRRPMTVQDLLRHTSGLVYGQYGDDLVHKAYIDAKVADRGQTLAEMVTKLSKMPLAHQPGRVWEYSMSVDVLGRIVEVVSGKELDAFVADRIAKPLGMTATDFYVHEPDLARLAEAQPPPAGSDARMPPDVTKKPRFVLGRRRAGGERRRLSTLYRDAAQRWRIRQRPPPGTAHCEADDLECAAA